MAATLYDSIVIGAGIEGSSTAYHLAKNRKRTLLLEQFPLPHSRGSSHGQSRITRKAYGTGEHYTKMMFEAYSLLEELEKESNTQLYRKTGLLFVGPKTHGEIRGTINSLSKYNVHHTVYNDKLLHENFPMMSFPAGTCGVLDSSGGVLLADKTLAAFQTQFVKYGGELKDNEHVNGIYPGSTITVRTTKGSYTSKSLVIAAGPWSKNILSPLGLNLPLKVVRISVMYWKEKTPGEYGADKFPTFLHVFSVDGFDIYGLPSLEYPGLFKLCLHSGPEIDPDRRDEADSTWVLNNMVKYVKEHFPCLESKPSIVETCIYTNTPDHGFILDTHPHWKNIVVGAGFSGHGFKLSPVVGKVLAQLATNEKPAYDMSHFKMDRFNRSKL